MVNVKINFLHDARPYTLPSIYENMQISFPEGILSNRGDIIQIDKTIHPEGAFFVNHRVFEVDSESKSLSSVTLTIGVEGVNKIP